MWIKFALIKNDVVVDVQKVRDTWSLFGSVESLFPEADVVIDVTTLDPLPAPGWVYDGTSFTNPDR